MDTVIVEKNNKKSKKVKKYLTFAFFYVIFEYCSFFGGGDNMDSEYILNLFNQFHKAVGTSVNDWTSQQNIFEFSDWLREYKEVVKKYSLYNEYLGIDLANPFLAEVGKGKYDSIVKENAIIISPYATTLKKEQSSLIVLENTPLIATQRGIVKSEGIEMFLTHNPYNEQSINDWYKIHNSQNHDICIGVYGKIYDKNKNEKIKMLEILLSNFNDEYEENYDELDDNYFYNIKSSRKVLTKVYKRR